MEIDQKHPYHSISIEETLEKVSGKKEGLSSGEVQKRQEQFGKNKIKKKGGTNPLLLFLKQFKDSLFAAGRGNGKNGSLCDYFYNSII